MNPYKEILKINLNRLLNFYDLDPSSTTYGFGDRLYWGWKLSDFSNGSMQGGVHSLSIAIRLGLFENEHIILAVIDSAIKSIEKIRAKDGSLSEAFPQEHSFCVTALTAFDALSAIDHLGDRLSDSRRVEYLGIVEPLIDHITQHEEKHAIISNHIATAAAAILLWNRLANQNNLRYRDLLNIIYQHQSVEGWYREYEGADPGYQTLCTYYLSIVLAETGDSLLLESLAKSAGYLKHFVHPDGTIGGLYGSRNTEVFYPGGIINLARSNKDFAIIANHLLRGLIDGNHVMPQDIDAGNFIPLINAYAVAAFAQESQTIQSKEADGNIPYKENFTKNFTESGLYIYSNSSYYAIVNYKKGGTIKLYNKETGILDFEDGGLFGELTSGQKFSTQHFDSTQTFNEKTIICKFSLLNNSHPTSLQFILIRMMALTVFNSVTIRNLFKKIVVRMLITRKKLIDGGVERRFEFLDKKIIVHEIIALPHGCLHVGHMGKCRSIHMASSGYYLRQMHEATYKSMIIEFRQENRVPLK